MMDLHMHSRFSSDGEFAPEELVRLCAEKGITVMAVADHNTAAGVKRAQEAAKKLSVTCIPAIEIDCTWQGIDLHVLGYGIDPKAEDILRLAETADRRDKEASLKLFEKICALGFDVDAEELEAMAAKAGQPGIWTGELFAEYLLQKPEYSAHERLLPYRAGGERSDNPFVNFYWDLCSQGKPCYVKTVFPSAAETVRMIHKNGGVAVLAHPGVNLKGREALLPQLFEIGLDGIEACSSYHTAEQTAFFADFAAKHDLLVTCGSDFHGKTKPAVYPGKFISLPCLKESEEKIRKMYKE